MLNKQCKTPELCQRCKYGFDNWCVSQKCDKCENARGKQCRCLDIQHGEHCEYYVKREGGRDAE